MAESGGSQHPIEINVDLNFRQAQQQAEQFRQEQAGKPVNMPAAVPGAAGPSAVPGGTSGSSIAAAQIAREQSAVRQAQQSVDLRNASVPTSAQAFINQSLERLGPGSVSGFIRGQPASEQLAILRGIDPKGYAAYERASDVAQRADARRQQQISRFSERTETLYENRLASDAARQQAANAAVYERNRATFYRTTAGLQRDAERTETSVAWAQQKAENRAQAAQQKAEERQAIAAEKEAAAAEKRAQAAERASTEYQRRVDRANFGAGLQGASRADQTRMIAGRLGRQDIDPMERAQLSGRYNRLMRQGSEDDDDDRGFGRFWSGYAVRRGLSYLSQIGHATLRRNEDFALAGRDQTAQLQAEQQYQQSLGQLPIAGPVAEIVANSIARVGGTDRVSTELIARSAQAVDQQTVQLTKSQDYARQLSERAVLLGTPQEGLARARQAAQFERDASQRANLRVRSEAGEADAAVLNVSRTAAEWKYRTAPDLLRGALPGLSATGPIGAYLQDKISGIGDAGYNQEISTIQANSRQLAVQRQLAFQRNESAAQSILDIKLADADKQQWLIGQRRRREVINNRTAGAGDQFQEGYDTITANTATEADAGNGIGAKLRAYETGLSRLNRFVAESAREMQIVARSVGAETSATRYELSGDARSAARERLEEQRRQALDRLPTSGVATKEVAEARQRVTELFDVKELQSQRQIDAQLQYQGALRRASVTSTGLQAEGRPIAGQIEEIVDQTLAGVDKALSTKRGIGGRIEASERRQIGINELRTLERGITLGGLASEVQSGTFAPGSGNGGPRMEEMVRLLGEVRDAIKQLGGN